MDQDSRSTKSSPPNASANTTSKHNKARSIIQNDSKRKAERDADHQPIEFIHSIKNGRTNNNKLFKLINTDENTVKQNNFYFTKQQKKLQQMKPDKSANDNNINLSENNNINDENLSETSSSSPPTTKIKTEDVGVKNLSSPISKKADKMHTKIRWRPVSSPKHESPSLAIPPPPQQQQSTQLESENSPFSPPTVENDASSKSNNVGITYILSPIPSNGSTNVADAEIPKNEKLEQQQQQQQQQPTMPIMESTQDQQPQRIPFPPFAPFPPFYGAPYGMIPFPPPFPPELSTHAIPQPQLGQQPAHYPPYPPDFQPPPAGMYPPPQMMIPPPTSNNMAQDETSIKPRDETPLNETTPAFDNTSADGSKSSRRRSRMSSSFVPPMPIFPPPPPARSGSNGPNLIPHYPPNPNLEKANLLSLLNASSNLPEIDVDFYKAVGSLDYLLKLKRKLEEKNADLENTQNGNNEDNDDDENNNDNNNDNNDINNNENAEQESETEEELAFMDRKMEKYYFREGNDLDNYYNQIKYKRVAPYIVNKVTIKEDENSMERGSDLEFNGVEKKPIKTLDDKIDQLNKTEKRKFDDVIEDYQMLNETFNEELEKNFQMRKAEILQRIENVQKGQDDEFNLETVELEEKRDFELLRLKNFRDFERNENLRLYFDDSLTIYQDFSQLMLQKLSSVKNFLIYQREILGNDLDKEFLDISSAKSGRFIKSFGSKNSDLNDDTSNYEIPKPTKDVVTTIQISTETSSSDTDLTTSNTGAPPPPLVFSKAKKFGKAKRPQPPALKKFKKAPVQQYQLDDYTPLLNSTEFEFITDTSSNFYSKIIKYFENTKASSNQQQQQLMSPNTRSTKSSKRSSSPSSKKLSNLAKSIRDSNGFSGGLLNANDYSAQLQKVMKLYTAPSKLNDDEILTDLKMMGKDVDKWIL